jgi:hypothetical protein
LSGFELLLSVLEQVGPVAVRGVGPTASLSCILLLSKFSNFAVLFEEEATHSGSAGLLVVAALVVLHLYNTATTTAEGRVWQLPKG